MIYFIVFSYFNASRNSLCTFIYIELYLKEILPCIITVGNWREQSTKKSHKSLIISLFKEKNCIYPSSSFKSHQHTIILQTQSLFLPF